MLNPRTPGVYVQELSLLPPSVAPVATAIPAFIGYTQKRGTGFAADTPKRITSLVDYEQTFGGPFDENYKVILEDDNDDPLNPKISVEAGTSPDASPYLLYYAVQHYFANGGGPCYIVSIGLYDYDAPGIDPGRFTDGVDALEQEDEPTLIVVPEAVGLDTLKRTDLHNQMLGQCNKMQDRFALMDVLVDESRSIDPLEDANDFRNEIGISYLKYGAAYYPSLKTTITKYYDEETVNIQDDRLSPTPSYNGEPLSTLLTGTSASIAATGEITVGTNADISSLEVESQGIPFVVDAASEANTANNIANAINGANIQDVSALAATNVVTVSKTGGTATVGYSGSGTGITVLNEEITVADATDISFLVVDGQQVPFAVGGDADATAQNIKTAITTLGPASVVASDHDDNDKVLITAATAGNAGNNIAMSFTGAGVSVSANLSGGSEDGKTAATATLTITSGFKKINHQFTIGAVSFTPDITPGVAIGASSAATAKNIHDFINDPGNGFAVEASIEGSEITLTAASTGVAGNTIELAYQGTSGARFSGATLEGGTGGDDTPDVALYQRIIKKLNTYKVSLYPSAAMAGIYARVDRNRGVWKAPANVSVNMVEKPNVMVTADEQGSLNVDANTGKSVNVIRSFAGKGTLVWGARTLAGNDNEWRYVPVRRLFIFIEESIEKASEPFVFEPNDANTWVKMKGMIENFLTSLWRDGALAGAAPSDAFFVKVGLGETMTSLDILEGRLNIEVGIAAVRPAEFIILKFSHKLQES